jgi:phosphoribosyl 1,2-cyclic phosphodiesterase
VICFADLSGVLITHVHSDHINERSVHWLINARVPIYCPYDLELQLQARYGALARASHLGLLKRLDEHEHELGCFQIRSFPVPHDSPGGCFGYGILYESDGRTKTVTIATDLAVPTSSAIRAFADTDIIVIESNHDSDMLEQSSRPFWLKKRIRERGYLSNSQCIETILGAIDRSSHLPHSIVLAHVSQECNTNTLAIESVAQALHDMGIHNIELLETHPSVPSQAVQLYHDF